MPDKDWFERFLDRYFEPNFFRFRYLVLIVVISSLLGSLTLFLVGAWKVFSSIGFFFVARDVKGLIIGLISSVDVFLFGLVMMIFSMGIYDLFVSKLDPARAPGNSPEWIMFQNIDELKSSLAKVVVIILIITFFELTITEFKSFSSNWELLVIPAGIVMIGLGLKMLHPESHRDKHGH